MHRPDDVPARHLLQLAALGVTLSLWSVGCGGYCPVRWPKRALWAPNASPRHVIQLPSVDVSTSPGHTQQDTVSIVIELIDSRRTTALFGANLVQHGVQPILVAIRNGSEQPYVFSKSSVDRRFIPAVQAARWAYVHPAITIARYVKWVVFFVPGLVMESLIEPASTFDFSGFEEAAQRPPGLARRSIRDEFIRNEIADAEIAPGGVLAGVMFIRPLTLGKPLFVPLINARTKQPLMFEIPTPPPVYSELHDYSHPYDTVWGAVLKTAVAIRGWRVMTADQTSGVVTVKRALHVAVWSTVTPMTITVRKVAEDRTQVQVQSVLRHPSSVAYGEHSPTLDTFFRELEPLLPNREKLVPGTKGTR